MEFASRTYDPATRQWVQDDRYRGTVTRAASMNRYSYVEGAPETFVDELGFYRARAAIRAQALAAWEAANAAALAAYEKAVQIAYKEAVSYQQTCGKYGCVKADMEVRGHYGFLNPYDAIDGHYGYNRPKAVWDAKMAKLQQAYDDAAYWRAKAGLPADPLAEPEVFEDKGFFGNGFEAAKGFVGEAWNTAKSMATSGFDTSAFSFVFRHDQWEVSAAQQHDAFWDGIHENGVVGQLTIQLNPVYQGIDAYVGAQEAFDRGDYRAVGENAFKFEVAVVSTAAIAIPGAQLAVAAGARVLDTLAIAAQAEANIARVETAIASATARAATVEATAAAEATAGAVGLPARALLGLEEGVAGCVGGSCSLAQFADLQAARAHLATIEGALTYEPNAVMLARIEEAVVQGRALTVGQTNFLAYEVWEAQLVAQGMELEAAHQAVLRVIPGGANYDLEVLLQFPDRFGPGAFDFWGMEKPYVNP